MKIICAGFHKTGTTSLHVDLEHLGYNVMGARIDLANDLIKNNLIPALEIVDRHDAFLDNPWPLLYKEIDQRYPESKFILTLRDEDKWIKSVVNHFGTDNTSMRKWIYGVGHPKGAENVYLDRFRKHNQEVLDYFKNRKKDLLIVSWENGAGWLELCNFLKKPIPNIPFPHSNK